MHVFNDMADTLEFDMKIIRKKNAEWRIKKCLIYVAHNMCICVQMAKWNW